MCKKDRNSVPDNSHYLFPRTDLRPAQKQACFPLILLSSAFLLRSKNHSTLYFNLIRNYAIDILFHVRRRCDQLFLG